MERKERDRDVLPLACKHGRELLQHSFVLVFLGHSISFYLMGIFYAKNE
jgi:hypothetical protein